MYNDIYHVNYDEDELRKTWHVIFLRMGSLRHVVYRKGYARVKKLKTHL